MGKKEGRGGRGKREFRMEFQSEGAEGLITSSENHAHAVAQTRGRVGLGHREAVVKVVTEGGGCKGSEVRKRRPEKNSSENLLPRFHVVGRVVALHVGHEEGEQNKERPRSHREFYLCRRAGAFNGKQGHE